MKKCLCLIFNLIFNLSLFSVTELEILWQQGMDFNSEIISSKYSQEYFTNSLKNKNYLYPFSLSSSINSSFNDNYSSVAWCSTSSNIDVSLLKQNPAGNNISMNLSYGINRGILDYFSDVDIDNIGYAQSPSVSVVVSQSLQPFFLQGIKNDPNIQLLQENLKLAKYSEEKTEWEILENITNNYIQFRCLNRLLNKTDKYLSFYEKYKNIIEEEILNGLISSSSLWDVENYQWDYFEDFVEYTNSQENVLLVLQNYCNQVLSISEKAELPVIKSDVYKYNPYEEEIVSMLNKEKLQYVLDKQSYSPVLSFGGSFSEMLKTKESFSVNYIEDKSYFDWSFSVGINFDEFFSPAKKLRQNLHHNNLAFYSSELEIMKSKINYHKNNCEYMINSYKNQIKKAEVILQNRHKNLENYEQLFSSGKCSEMEFEEAKLKLADIECIYENLKDYLWLYTWKRTFYK